MPLTILHNPKCSKSRKSLEILKKSGKSFVIKDYMASAITPEELKEVLKKLKASPRQILREKEANEAGIAHLNGLELLNAICKNPRTLERPIVINEDKAVIGRPPENILKIL
uniref:Arsenate reductase and related proteins, glutaredoxin family n=1 Tax=uncultured nuHF1 cluster bacterium HF0770_35I22 TaxID=723586 RepID=E7C7N0_9BACT|nr:arsenate reductase and related proteins, glutaredoxin family [uncultured nuHF1 cluster bacterium HF0770_35I22]